MSPHTQSLNLSLLYESLSPRPNNQCLRPIERPLHPSTIHKFTAAHTNPSSPLLSSRLPSFPPHFSCPLLFLRTSLLSNALLSLLSSTSLPIVLPSSLLLPRSLPSYLTFLLLLSSFPSLFSLLSHIFSPLLSLPPLLSSLALFSWLILFSHISFSLLSSPLLSLSPFLYLRSPILLYPVLTFRYVSGWTANTLSHITSFPLRFITFTFSLLLPFPPRPPPQVRMKLRLITTSTER